MSGAILPFVSRYRQALADQRLSTNLLTFQRAWRQTRENAFNRLPREAPLLGAAFPSFLSARQRLVEAKDAVLDRPGSYQQQFIERATRRGAQIHEVATAAEARELIARLLRE